MARVIGALLWAVLGLSLPAEAVMLAWDASPGAQGYALHYGESPGLYHTSLDTGPATQASVSGLTPGQTYYFAATAYNGVGESDFSNEVSSVIPEPDTTPPTVAITAPANGATIPRGTNLTITATAADNVAVTQVIVTVKNSSNQIIKTCPDAATPYQCVWAVPSPPHRTYTIEATAEDAAGNSAVATIQVTT
jgi:hypothetical protein